MNTKQHRYSAEELNRFVRRALQSVGMPDEDAQIVARLMTEIDLSGGDGHGIFRLPQYIQRIRDGGLNLNPKFKIERETEAMALLNGDNAMGHLVMQHAADIAVNKARKSGVAWVGAKFSNHAGAAGVYAKLPLAEDMIGLYVAIGNANHLPPWGGIEMLLSTNPIAVAVPALKQKPIVLDMATTVAAYGKVKTAAQRGETMPEGWMIDKQGKPLTDPKRANEGFLLPIGGAKGYGLALIFGILAGTLNGAAFGRDVVDFNADSKTTTNTGQFIVAINVAAFMDVDQFKRQVDEVILTMKASPTLPGFDQVRLPGEQSWKTYEERSKTGIPMHPSLHDKLSVLSKDLGIVGLSN
ncbi:Ldh family oxidoreductase [Pseudomonadota bacterium]